MSAAKTAARVKAGSLDVDKKLYDFINKEVLPGTGVREKSFWSGFGKIVNALTP